MDNGHIDVATVLRIAKGPERAENPLAFFT
jgi:hypothetical protein